MAVLPVPASARYTAFYCEENIYHLVASLQSSLGESSGTRVYAVFISNAERKSLLFHQKAADPEQGYVIWDYHVVAITVTPRAGSAEEVVRVFDPDSNLDEFEGDPEDGNDDGSSNGFDFDDYVQETFRPDLYAPGGVIRTIFELDEPRFRVVPADNFLENFASDRSHMLLESAQSDVDVVPPPVLQYFKPMPTWAPIVGSSARSRGESNNLFSRWLDMSDETQALAASFKHNENLYGRVYSLKSFAGKSDWIGPVRASESQRDQAHPSHLAALAEKTYQIPSAPHDSPLLSQPVPLSILASPHESTSEKAAHLAKKAERTVQRALIPVSPEGIGSEGSSGRWPSYLPQKQLVISIFVSLGINFAIPFVNGVMLGFGEIFARDWFAPWVGLTSWSSSHYRRAASTATQHKIGIRVVPNPNPHPEQRGGKREVPGHPAAKSIIETAAEQVVAGSI